MPFLPVKEREICTVHAGHIADYVPVETKRNLVFIQFGFLITYEVGELLK